MRLFAKKMDSASKNCSWGVGSFDRLTKQAVRAYDASKDVRHPYHALTVFRIAPTRLVKDYTQD
jgi:hypothetical protein